MMQTSPEISRLKDFQIFLPEFKQTLSNLFEERNKNYEKFRERGFTNEELAAIMESVPLSVAVPKEYGGRGLIVKECLSVLEAASYESLSLSLIFGINIALFLEPIAKYGDSAVKAKVYNTFINEAGMGGLMISEPNHGSDALNIKTSCVADGDHYLLKGEKHWQGLTGAADYWLVAARDLNDRGDYGRDIGLFLTDNSDEEQHIPVKEYYNNNGLHPIPYGLNTIDVKIPKTHRLIPESTGLKMLMDVLHRSRMQFPGMAMGFLHRILEEATQHCNDRHIRGNSLLQFDQVQFQLAQLQSAYTICSAMCNWSSKTSGVDVNLATEAIQANTIKARVTDLMQHAAQTLTQLKGSSGYKIKSLGSRGILDSRPFQIFEGPNEMLYGQIAEAAIKTMGKKKLATVQDYLAENDLLKSVASIFTGLLDFGAERTLSQRKQVVLGQIIGRVVTVKYMQDMENDGFNKGLVDMSIDLVRSEIAALATQFQDSTMVTPVADYRDGSVWNML